MSTDPRLTRADYNPFDPAHKRDPFPFYAQARRDTPVFYSPMLNMWVVTRHEDILTVLNEPTVFSSRQTLDAAMTLPPPVLEILSQGIPLVPTLINNDPPAHKRIRNLCNKAFSVQRVAKMETRIRELAQALVDGFCHEGRADLMARFANPLPRIVIADIVGVPRADTERFVQLGGDAAALLFEVLPLDVQIKYAHSAVAFQRYIAEMIARRRERPQDDLMSDLVHAQEEGEASLTDWEVINIVTSLLIAGHPTTTDLIGNALLVLMREPETMAALAAQPELAAACIEEVLRLESPAPGLPRVATQDFNLSGVLIPQGARLFLLYTSANRDEKVFANPDKFDIKRESLNQHLAFGRGIHYCIGAPLGRLEGRIALEVLIARLPNLRVEAAEEIDFSLNLTFRGPNKLMCCWNA